MKSKKEEIKNMLDILEKRIVKNLSKENQIFLKKKKLLSIVIPAYNEEKNIPLIIRQIVPILESLNKKTAFEWQKYEYDYEIIFINDGSKDNTWCNILELSKQNSKIKWINFSRNFGKEIALSAWLEYTNWDAVITLDADWQHPVIRIPDFLQKWENGYDIVYNIRPKTKWSSLFKTITSKMFYIIYNNLSNLKLETWVTDYRLLDKKVVKTFLGFKEKNRIYRWIIDYMWFKKIALTFDALERMEWEASYSLSKLIKLAIDSVTSFSIKPLNSLLTIWWIMILFGLLWYVLLIMHFFGISIIENSIENTIIISNVFFFWIIMCWLWLVGIYIWNIHEEVKQRPLFIVDESANFDINKSKKINEVDKKYLKKLIHESFLELKSEIKKG